MPIEFVRIEQVASLSGPPDDGCHVLAFPRRIIALRLAARTRVQPKSRCIGCGRAPKEPKRPRWESDLRDCATEHTGRGRERIGSEQPRKARETERTFRRSASERTPRPVCVGAHEKGRAVPYLGEREKGTPGDE